ncbi:MAG: AAA family ATPase, partial [Acidobacteriota bacterium]
DDARRAVYAARMLVEGAQGRLSGALSLRLGIHTGPVVVAPQTAGDSAGAKLAFGQTLAWVAGLTSLAKPGQILLSAATQTTVARFFRLHPMPPVAIPGLGPAVEAFRDGGDLENPEDMPHAAAPFVGREQQLLILLDHWQLAREGSGQAVLMSGEAGIGKSRLVREVETRASSGGLVLRCQCTPYERHTPFAPIVHLLGQLIGTEHDPSTPKESALRRFLDSYDLPQDEMMPLLASLLAISWDGESRPADLAPPVLRRQTLEALVTLLLEMAERSPLLLVVEDLHWIDPSSQELIDLLVQHGPSVPVLLLLTARPNFESPWNQRAHLVRMTLGRLGREHVENLIRSVAEDELPPGVLEAIVDRADGVPLFVEEITKVMTETRRRSGGGRGAGPRPSPP